MSTPNSSITDITIDRITIIMCDSLYRVIDKKSSQGEIKQKDTCLDTLAHSIGNTVGMYKCHGGGGNQVS